MVRKINSMLKKVYIDKLQQYDYLINEKEIRSTQLEQNISAKVAYYQEILERIEALKEKEEKKDNNSVVLPTEADFEDENILEGYKKIKEGFGFDKDKIIKDFIDNNVSNDNHDYEVYCKIKNYFTHKVTYKIATYSKDEQKLIVSNLLTEEEQGLVKNILNMRKFSIEQFLNRLDDLIDKNNPTITIYVGDKNENYDKFSNQIVTKYDKKIVDGFKIEYKGRIYDYSI